MPKNSKELFNDALYTGDHGRRDRNRKLDDTRKLDFSQVRIPLKESPVISSPLYDLVEDAGLRKPDNWLYETLSDPKLNRGIENLAGNVYDIIMGEESGNPVVDYGTSNIPGVGPASILAAGGIPGLIDLAGMRGAGNAVKGLVKWAQLKEMGRLMPELNTLADAIEASPNRDLLASLFVHGDLAGMLRMANIQNVSAPRNYVVDQLSKLRDTRYDKAISKALADYGGDFSPSLDEKIVLHNLARNLQGADINGLVDELSNLRVLVPNFDVGGHGDIIKSIGHPRSDLSKLQPQLAQDALEGVPREVMDEYLRRMLSSRLNRVRNKIPYIEEALDAMQHGHRPKTRAAIDITKEATGADNVRDFDFLDPEEAEQQIAEYLEDYRNQETRLAEYIRGFGGDPTPKPKKAPGEKAKEEAAMRDLIEDMFNKEHAKPESNPDQLSLFGLFDDEPKPKPEPDLYPDDLDPDELPFGY